MKTSSALTAAQIEHEYATAAVYRCSCFIDKLPTSGFYAETGYEKKRRLKACDFNAGVYLGGAGTKLIQEGRMHRTHSYFRYRRYTHDVHV